MSSSKGTTEGPRDWASGEDGLEDRIIGSVPSDGEQGRLEMWYCDVGSVSWR
jgi:hypothetical protein